MYKYDSKKINEFLKERKYILIEKETGQPLSFSSKGFTNKLNINKVGTELKGQVYYLNVAAFSEQFPLKNLYIVKKTGEYIYLKHNPLKNKIGKDVYQKARDKIVWKKISKNDKIEIKDYNKHFESMKVKPIDFYIKIK